jgi:hypothetical protein
MSNVEVEPRIDTFVDERTRAEAAVVGLLAEHEFAWAQTVIPDLNHYPDYQDWLADREGLQMGLAMAGVDARFGVVPLAMFLTWCRLSGELPSERRLNDFAAKRLSFKDAPAAFAAVRRRDFESHVGDIDAFAQHGDYDAWLRHRDALRQSVGSSAKELPVHVGDFLAWSQCLDEGTSEMSLDGYATLAMKFLAQDLEDKANKF